MLFDELDESNYTLFAMKHYDNPECKDVDEFYEDINRTKYLKRLLRRYRTSGILRERLILNHIIVLNNVFGNEASATLLLYKIEQEYWAILKTFLVFLKTLNEEELPGVKISKNLLTNLENIK